MATEERIKPPIFKEGENFLYNFYFDYVNNPDLSNSSHKQFQHELDLFSEYALKYSKGKKLLEIGCGMGRTLFNFPKLGFECHGIDFNPLEIALAKKAADILNITGITFTVSETDSIDYANDSFDIIISNDLIEHLPDKERMEYLHQAYRLLKKDGVLLVHSLPTKYSYLFSVKFIWLLLPLFFLSEKHFNIYLKKLDKSVPKLYFMLTKKKLMQTWMESPPGHCNAPDYQEFTQQLKDSSFSVEHFRVYTAGNHKISKLLRKILPFKKLYPYLFFVAIK